MVSGEGESEEVAASAKRGRIVFFSIWGVLILGIALLFRAVLFPFLLAVVVAYVIAPVVRQAELLRFRGKSAPRWVIVATVYLILLGGLAGFGTLAIPRIGVEIEHLATDIPHMVVKLRQRWIPEIESRLRGAMADYEEKSSDHDDTDDTQVIKPVDATTSAAEIRVPRDVAIHMRPRGDGFDVVIPHDGLRIRPDGEEFVIGGAVGESGAKEQDLVTTMIESMKHLTADTQKVAVTLIKTAQAWVSKLVRGVFMFFIVLMLSAYLLISSSSIYAFFRGMARRPRNFDRLVMRIDRGLSGVVRGQLMIALVNGILSGIGFYFLELKYWPILTLVATLFSIIPIFGAIISSIPAVLIGLQDGLTLGFLVFLWILLIHQIEANLLNPKIMGDAAQVHPVLVVFALLAGEHLFGIAGALLAVPILSITQSLFLHHYDTVRLNADRQSFLPNEDEADGSQGAT